MQHSATVAVAALAAVGPLGCALLFSTDGYSDAPDAAASDGADRNPTDADVSSEPTVFASGQGLVGALSQSADTLYWTVPSQSAVRSCSVTGCAKPTDVATGGQPNGLCWKMRPIWTDEVIPKVFFLDNGGKVASIDLSWPADLACDGEDAYVLGDEVRLLRDDPPSDTTSFLTTSVVPSHAAVHAGLAVADATKVYLVVDDVPTPVADDVASALAIDDAQILWATKDGRLRTRQRAGGAIIELAGALSEPAGVMADPEGVYVYFTVRGTLAANYLDGFVAKVPRGGGAYTVIAKNQPRPERITLAAGQVYWSNTYDGTIRRVRK